MAQSTVELRHLLATNFKLFDFEYQFDDKKFKAQLEEAVIEFYYSQEIGQETPDMFKQKFKARWKRMIGYYNQLYNTTLLEYNPLINYKMSEAMEQLARSSSTSDTTSSSKATGKASTDNQTTTDQTSTSSGGSSSNEKASDYPQQSISGGDYLSGERVATGTNNNTTTTDGETNSLSTASTEDSGTATGKTESSGQNNSSYEKTVEGLTGVPYQDLVRKQRELILRIPDMVINEMKPCFMMVF